MTVQAKIDETASDAVEEAAEAEAGAAAAVTNAAEAEAENQVAQATIATVAAAESIKALAVTQAAETNQAAASVVAKTHGDLEWLHLHATATDNSLKELTNRTEAVKEIPELKATLSKVLTALERLTPPPLSPVEPGLETQIVDPATVASAAVGGLPEAKDKKSPTSKVRHWTTGKRS